MNIDSKDTRTGSAPALSEEDRRVAFNAGAPKVPRKVLYWGAAVLLVLGVGGALLENLLSAAGIPSGSSANPNIPPTTIEPSAPALNGPLAAFLSLQSEHSPAPAFSLTSSNGKTVSLASLRGKVIVLSFFDARCQDICPIEADELRRADGALGGTAGSVEFLTINVDPVATTPLDAKVAGARSGLSSVANWQFLTSSFSTLNALWSAYGIAVDYQPSTGAIAHSEYLYVIDANGMIRYRITTFANETKNGSYTLDEPSIARFANGLANYVAKVVAVGTTS